MQNPNFFLIGAPKSGTTSMADYLSHHPNVFFSTPKEPQYFAKDFANTGSITERDRYMALFEKASDEHMIVGEGSTKYLRSKTAVPLIEDTFPNSRYLVMLRNPIEMARSLHEQVLFNGDETEPDFAKAWALQTERQQGQNIPATCEEPLDLQYGYFCKIGEQLEALFAKVEKSRVQVLLFDEFKADAAGSFATVLNFLGLPPHLLESYPSINTAKRTKFELIKSLTRILRKTKQKLNINVKFGIAQKINLLNSRQIQREPLPQSFIVELQAYFHDDIEKLSKLIDKDLSHWKKV